MIVFQELLDSFDDDESSNDEKQREEKSKLNIEQGNLKDDLNSLGGEISGMESVLRTADNEATTDTSVDENSERIPASTGKLHPLRKVLKSFVIHKIVAVFEKATVKEEERTDMLELLNRVYHTYCELIPSKSHVNLLELYSNLPENQKRWEETWMEHPWLLLKERGDDMTLDQLKTFLYGSSELGTLPRHFEQQGNEIPKSVVMNDLDIIKGWTTLCESIGQLSDGAFSVN